MTMPRRYAVKNCVCVLFIGGASRLELFCNCSFRSVLVRSTLRSVSTTYPHSLEVVEITDGRHAHRWSKDTDGAFAQQVTTSSSVPSRCW